MFSSWVRRVTNATFFVPCILSAQVLLWEEAAEGDPGGSCGALGGGLERKGFVGCGLRSVVLVSLSPPPVPLHSLRAPAPWTSVKTGKERKGPEPRPGPR